MRTMWSNNSGISKGELKALIQNDLTSLQYVVTIQEISKGELKGQKHVFSSGVYYFGNNSGNLKRRTES